MASFVNVVRDPTMQRDLMVSCARAARSSENEFQALGEWEGSLQKGGNLTRGIHNPMAPTLANLWSVEQLNEKSVALQSEFAASKSAHPEFDRARRIGMLVLCLVGVVTAIFLPWVALGIGVVTAALLIYDIYQMTSCSVHGKRYQALLDEFGKQWVDLGKVLYVEGPRATYHNFYAQQLKLQKGVCNHEVETDSTEKKCPRSVDMVKDPVRYYLSYLQTAFNMAASLIDRVATVMNSKYVDWTSYDLSPEQRALFAADRQLAILDQVWRGMKRDNPVAAAKSIHDFFCARASEESVMLMSLTHDLATKKEPTLSERIISRFHSITAPVQKRCSALFDRAKAMISPQPKGVRAGKQVRFVESEGQPVQINA